LGGKYAPWQEGAAECSECGAENEHDRDVNAAINIERKGILELQAARLIVSAHGGHA
jgi:putative transposase